MYSSIFILYYKNQDNQIRLSQASILIVDDDRDILYFFRVLLEENGYQVETVETGAEAITRAKEDRFDVVLLDYKLPDTNGEDLADELKRMNESVEIIFITGYSSLKDGEVPQADSVREVLVKPINDDALLTAVRNAAPESLA